MSDHRRESLNAFPDNPAEIADGHILGRDPRESCAQESLAVSEDICLDVRGVSLFDGDKQALNDVSLAIPRNRVTAFIGPSGCGKSTLLRCFNRMNDFIDDVRVTGEISLNGENIHDRSIDVAQLRRLVGMVFQRTSRIRSPSPSTRTWHTAFDYSAVWRARRSMIASSGD